MKPKLLFWIDTDKIHFFLAKYIQDNLDCEMYSIFEITDKPKIFFQNQKFVKFKKVWFYHDYILKTKRKPDLDYIKSIEEKYNIFLLLIAANDRFFNHFRGHHLVGDIADHQLYFATGRTNFFHGFQSRFFIDINNQDAGAIIC